MGIDEFVADTPLSDDEVFERALHSDQCDEYMEGCE